MDGATAPEPADGGETAAEFKERIEARMRSMRSSAEWRRVAASLEHAAQNGEAVADEAGAGETVMLAFRVPRWVRERAHLAARASGAASTQEWLLQVVTDAVDVTTTPGGRQASLLWEAIREHMRRLVDDGTYERVASQVADPMLSP
ncbi:MAG: hypothetical protein ACRDZR_08235 [Acidimicrobiales bacterium]